MKARAFAWLKAVEAAIYTRPVFAGLSWLAVILALISIVFGAKWAAASCAISLAVLAHVGMALLTSAGILANNFETIRGLYNKEVQANEKQTPQEAQQHPLNIH
jgi:hypothetical protein